MVIVDGTFELVERRTAGVADADQPPITIKAARDTNYALILMKEATLKRADTAPQVKLKLKIETADLSFRCFGAIEMYSMKSVEENDEIITSGKVDFSDDTVVRMMWFASDMGNLRANGETWTLLKCTLNTAMVDEINMTPTVFTKPPLGAMQDLILERHDGNSILRVRVVR